MKNRRFHFLIINRRRRPSVYVCVYIYIFNVRKIGEAFFLSKRRAVVYVELLTNCVRELFLNARLLFPERTRRIISRVHSRNNNYFTGGRDINECF